MHEQLFKKLNNYSDLWPFNYLHWTETDIQICTVIATAEEPNEFIQSFGQSAVQ